MMRVESVVTRSRSVWSEIPRSLRARSNNARTNALTFALVSSPSTFDTASSAPDEHVDDRALLHALHERIESRAERPEELSHPAVREPDLLFEAVHEIMQRLGRHRG